MIQYNFIGYRVFKLLEGKALLTSLNQNMHSKKLKRVSYYKYFGRVSYYKYFGPVSIIPEHKDVVTEYNNTGFWAFKDHWDNWDNWDWGKEPSQTNAYTHLLSSPEYVAAKVALFGTVMEHELGYRASKILILELHVHEYRKRLEKAYTRYNIIPRSELFISQLQERYKCDIIT